MKQHRISRVRVERAAEAFGYRLVTHQWLDNRKDYYYRYSLVKDIEGAKTPNESILVLVDNAELKTVYEYIFANIN